MVEPHLWTFLRVVSFCTREDTDKETHKSFACKVRSLSLDHHHNSKFDHHRDNWLAAYLWLRLQLADRARQLEGRLPLCDGGHHHHHHHYHHRYHHHYRYHRHDHDHGQGNDHHDWPLDQQCHGRPKCLSRLSVD